MCRVYKPGADRLAGTRNGVAGVVGTRNRVPGQRRLSPRGQGTGHIDTQTQRGHRMGTALSTSLERSPGHKVSKKKVRTCYHLAKGEGETNTHYLLP